MELNTYEFEIIEEGKYKFISQGRSGSFDIQVNFTRSSKENIYELEFGVIEVNHNILNQNIKINNQDTNIILNTVYIILYTFTNNKKNAMIRYSGSTKSRTRLFNIWISRNINLIKNNFHIYGYTNEKLWTSFETKNHYDAMILKRHITISNQ